MSKKPTPKRRQGSPKILLLDVETKPILAHVWRIWQENVGLNQIASDWSLLSFAAKWLDDPPAKMIYQDLSAAKDFDDDRPLLKSLWKLLDEADIVVTQNGVAFDKKKIYARFAIHNMKPPSPFKMIDTKIIAKRVFGFTSNRLEYLADKLNKKFKKSAHRKFAGFEMWKECLAGNQDAWRHMRLYNCRDVLALEELYHKLLPWDDQAPNFSVYTDDDEHVCRCGSDNVQRRGWAHTATGRYQRFQCQDCGAWSRGRSNQLSATKRRSLHANPTR